MQFRHGAHLWSVPCPPEAGLSVLDLARQAELPLPWQCHLGTCARCAVQIEAEPAAATPSPALVLSPAPSLKEQRVLARHGLTGLRLACQLVASAGLAVRW